MVTDWFAIRCCCSPQKVFGFIEMPVRDLRNGAIRKVIDQNGKTHNVEFKNITTRENWMDDNFNETRLAIYSDDREIEFWRTIRGFVEAKPTYEGAMTGRLPFSRISNVEQTEQFEL